MLLWLATYWYTSIRANLNIGVRHLMPVYGFTFIILSGGLAAIYTAVKKKPNSLYAFCLLLLVLFSWYFYENLSIYPYYLTYFNQAAGRPSNGYLYVVDSNLDWGQDLKRLTNWVEKNNISHIYLDYFGWADQNYYLGNKVIRIYAGKYNNARDFLRDNPLGGYIAVSATYFMGSREKPETSYAWLDNYKPVTIIGNSIFVWHITP